MEHTTMNDILKSTPEQKKALQKEILKGFAILVTMKIGIAVAIHLAARALERYLEKNV